MSSSEERLARLESLVGAGIFQDSGWLDLGAVATYAANWQPYGTATFRPMIRRLPSGLVIMRGLYFKNAAGAMPETSFTLNPSWRPGDTGYTGAGSTLIYNPANSASAYCEIRLDVNGIMQTMAGPAGGGTWISLAGVSYMLTR